MSTPDNDYYCLLCNRRLEIYSEKDIEKDQIEQLQNKEKIKNNNIPKCPTCGSTNIKKISASSKVFGAAMFGLFSKTARSQFECQKRFKKLRGVGNLPLSYDFYITHYNALIEYQGRQHQQAIDYFGGEEYHKTQMCHDDRKRKYAKENGYNYLEIRYFDYDNIEDILMSYFNSITNPVTTTA